MATILIAVVIIAALVAGWFLISAVARRTAAGDTPEAHDEINPHDMPRGHPGRPAAEQRR